LLSALEQKVQNMLDGLGAARGESIGSICAIYEHIYSPIRQTQTEKYRYIQKNTILGIIEHIIVKLTQQITNSFMQWNKHGPHAVVTLKNQK